MAGKSAVMLRLGVEGDEKIQAALRKIGQTGDQAFAGLSKEAKEAARSFDRLEKSVDAQARSAAQVARAYVSANQAIAAGVRTQADAQRVVDLAAERHRRLTGAVNDNAKAAGAPTSMPTGGVHRSIGADAANAGNVLDSFGGVPTAWLRRANGTGATPTAVASADIIGRMNFSSYYTSGGPAYSTAPASVRAVATENHTSTAQGAKLIWSATANGSASPSDYWTLGQDGSLTGIGALGYATGAGGCGGGLNECSFLSVAKLARLMVAATS